jgi:hypothetical protein
MGGVTGWAQEMCVLPRGTAPYDEMKTERLGQRLRRIKDDMTGGMGDAECSYC